MGKARVLIDSGQEMEALEEAEAAISGKEMVAGLYLNRDEEADAHAIIALVLHNKGLTREKAHHLQQIRILNPGHEILRIVS